MNYKEKYNEILEWARKNKARLNGVPIEEVLPELAESEDERMIERIELSLHSLKQWINGCDEMQPSRKEECITEIKEQEAWLEKQKEQKPVNKCDGCNNAKGCVTCVDGSEWAYYAETEQKPAEWSEEDEERLKAICAYLQDYPRLAKINDVKRFNEYCDWLKSLRPSWKPNEEQMKALDEYIYAKDLNTEKYSKAVLSLRDELKKLM